MMKLSKHIAQASPENLKQKKTVIATDGKYKTNLDGTIEDKYLLFLHDQFIKTANRELSKRKDRHGNPDIFVIDKDNSHFYGTLIRYFARHKGFFDSKIIKNEPSLDKGLLICGAPGLGKTLILSIFSVMAQALTYSGNSFAMIDSNQIVSEYDQFGESGIKDKYKGQRCFDDVGTEEIGQHYKQSEVLRKLIEQRYKLFINDLKKTHITTNLGKDELFKRYGTRADSRFYEMFNIITIDGKDRRKK
jgi:hypothetical protein